jgi:signal transduction histidine kinase
VDVLRLLALLVYTCGAFVFGAMSLLWLREFGRRAGRDRRRPPIDTVTGMFFLVSLGWFVLNLLVTLLQLGPEARWYSLHSALLWLGLTYPPLVMHLTSLEVTSSGAAIGRIWRALPWPAYTMTQAIVIWSLLGFYGVIDVADATVGTVLKFTFTFSFIGAAAYAMAIMRRTRPRVETPRERQSHRWHLALFLAMVVLFALLFTLSGTGQRMAVLATLVEISARSLPLAFLFVSTYFENRFEFFDLFVKRGLSLLLTIGTLTLAFAVTLPWLHRFETSWAAPWIFAIVLLPVIMALPWLYGRLGAALDRRWLGRRFTPVDAITRFLDTLRAATTDAQLVQRAQAGLSEIFSAPAAVQLGAFDDPGFPIAHESPVRSAGVAMGRICMGPRTSEAPYFSEDVALVTSLADVLGSVVENLRLQRRQQEQDLRASELVLQASRSELKALRAQINPHFLFNALNAIAGLIHRDPAAADRTIEQLADVFRYALRGAESEWAVLEDEIDFVRAYLDIERARFGARLQVAIAVEDGVRGARVPTMVIQTLVENAIKHGAAATPGPATVAIDARREQDRLLIAVTDNGPGFEAASTRRAPGARGGYGLTNVRQRLEGYFGANASLEIDRDEAQGLTKAVVTLPLAGQARAAASREPVR